MMEKETKTKYLTLAVNIIVEVDEEIDADKVEVEGLAVSALTYGEINIPFEVVEFSTIDVFPIG